MKEYKYRINGTDYQVKIQSIDGNKAEVEVNGIAYKVTIPEGEKKSAPKINRPKPVTAPVPSHTATPAAPAASKGGIKAPLPGVIVDILVNVGDTVKKGQKIAILEAMKMENNIESDRDGKVLEVNVKKGDSILEGNDIVVIG